MPGGRVALRGDAGHRGTHPALLPETRRLQSPPAAAGGAVGQRLLAQIGLANQTVEAGGASAQGRGSEVRRCDVPDPRAASALCVQVAPPSPLSSKPLRFSASASSQTKQPIRRCSSWRGAMSGCPAHLPHRVWRV